MLTLKLILELFILISVPVSGFILGVHLAKIFCNTFFVIGNSNSKRIKVGQKKEEAAWMRLNSCADKDREIVLVSGLMVYIQESLIKLKSIFAKFASVLVGNLGIGQKPFGRVGSLERKMRLLKQSRAVSAMINVTHAKGLAGYSPIELTDGDTAGKISEIYAITKV